jgi:hypothetical protein
VPDHKRLSANITAADDRALRDHAARHGESVTAAVDHAINRMLFVSAAQDRGAAIVVTEPDGQAREVLFPGL